MFLLKDNNLIGRILPGNIMMPLCVVFCFVFHFLQPPLSPSFTPPVSSQFLKFIMESRNVLMVISFLISMLLLLTLDMTVC